MTAEDHDSSSDEQAVATQLGFEFTVTHSDTEPAVPESPTISSISTRSPFSSGFPSRVSTPGLGIPSQSWSNTPPTSPLADHTPAPAPVPAAQPDSPTRQTAVPQERRRMAASREEKKFDYFTGEDPEEDPRKWLKRLGNRISESAKTDEEKIEAAGGWIDASTPAESWFEDEGSKLKTWKEFRTAFVERFERKTAESPEEAEEKVLQVELNERELGTMVKDKDGDILGRAHDLWIDKVCKVARKVKAEDNVAERVRRALPAPLKKYVNKPVKDFNDLQKKLHAVTSEQLGVELESQRRLQNLEDRLAQVPDTPTSSIRRSMQNVRIGTTGMGSLPVGEREFFSDTRMRPSNMFAAYYAPLRPPMPPPPPYPPFSPGRGRPYRPTQRIAADPQDRLRRVNANAIPPPPDTPDGRAAYQQQLNKWNADNPGNPFPNETRPYPLSPGTAAVGSNECFRCGKVGHRGTQCTSATNIPHSEYLWRREVARIKRAVGNPGPTDVAATYYVNAAADVYQQDRDPYHDYWVNYYPTYGYEDGQGNE